MQAKNRWTVQKNSTTVEGMALADPIPVRFRDESDARLSGVSSRSRMSKAELIRIAVDEFLDRVEQSGEIVQRVMLDAPSDLPIPARQAVDYKGLRRAKADRPKKK